MLRFVALASLLAEATGAVIPHPPVVDRVPPAAGRAAWNGLFQSVSAYNNAGFSTFSDNLVATTPTP